MPNKSLGGYSKNYYNRFELDLSGNNVERIRKEAWGKSWQDMVQTEMDTILYDLAIVLSVGLDNLYEGTIDETMLTYFKKETQKVF